MRWSCGTHGSSERMDLKKIWWECVNWERLVQVGASGGLL
jgi:hypothetical protein